LIHIQRVPEPQSLRRSVVSNARRSLSNRVTKNPTTRGSLKLEFKSDYYGHDDVRRALEIMQHGKCAFCESKLKHISYGDVEHFRPKAGWKQDEGDPLTKPGYYWLAYTWDNLLLSCQICNQREKRNLFPVATSFRALTHKDDVADEEPLFVDPSKDDPAAHITWRRWTPVPRSERGRVTIEELGLRREPLRQKREDRYTLLKAVFDDLVLLRTKGDVLDEDISRHIDRHMSRVSASVSDDSVEYAAMTRAAVGARFQLI
jgi:uncharacterized protein (TIGR02646 family)